MEKIKLLLIKAIEKKGTNPARLSQEAGLDISAVRKILDGSVKGTPKIDTLYKLSKALDIYPSELLPPEWQKPDASLNLNILEKSVQEVLESKGVAKLSSTQKAQLIIAAYVANINK